MITTADLNSQTRRELADLARDYGISGWHAMRKDDLLAELKKVQRRLKRAAAKNAKDAGVAKAAKPPKAPKKVAPKRRATISGKKQDQLRLQKPLPKLPESKVDPKSQQIRAQIRKRHETLERNRDLSTGTLVAGAAMESGAKRARKAEAHQDRVILMVRDAYWLQATWEITRASIDRARAALGSQWITATPILRVLTVGDIKNNSAESVAREIKIHGGVNNWYIDVDDPPTRFRVVIGYASADGQFYTLCRSNIVETPKPGDCERIDEHWGDIAEDYERIYSLSGGYEDDGSDLRDVFEERLKRPMPLKGNQGSTINEPSLLRQNKLPFEVDAELIVFGRTITDATVQVAGRPVKLQSDGSFTVRLELPDKRQVLPVTAETRDGLRQRTTVVAIERNTKVMETVEMDDRI
ncbi:MAG: DUF4912 domain-containing protein [Planctomycetota bacterium]